MAGGVVPGDRQHRLRRLMMCLKFLPSLPRT
jgi:hypothetical protein